MYMFLHQALSGITSRTHGSLLGLRRKVDTDTVDTVPFILGISKPLTLEDVSQVPAAVVAYDFCPHHTQAWVRPLPNGVGECVPESWPSAARIEFVVRFVQGRLASGTRVDAGVRIVLVKLA